MKLKEKIVGFVADKVFKIAIKAGGTASVLGTYQPKEPESLKKYVNQKKFF